MYQKKAARDTSSLSYCPKKVKLIALLVCNLQPKEEGCFALEIPALLLLDCFSNKRCCLREAVTAIYILVIGAIITVGAANCLGSVVTVVVCSSVIVQRYLGVNCCCSYKEKSIMCCHYDMKNLSQK